MIRINDILDTLCGLIGWRQAYDTSTLAIASSLTQSESGLYYQDSHPLLTLTNVASLAPDFANTHWQDYDAAESYKRGNVVKYTDGKLYKASNNVPANVSPTSDIIWKETDPFSEWLEAKTRVYVQKAITRYYNERMAKGTARSVLESKTLFDQAGRLTDTEAYGHKLVGMEIVPVRSSGVVTQIDKIGLQFNAPCSVTLYLMHSSQAYPIDVIELRYTKGGGCMQWFTLPEPMYLPYFSSDYDLDAGGSYYLVYEQDANARAVIKNRDWSAAPCNACSRTEYTSYLAWSKWLEVHPFEVVDGAYTLGEMWDLADNSYTYKSNHGINLSVSVVCDLTDFIVKHRLEFADLILKSVAVDFLREFVYNPNVRTNRNSLNVSKPDLMMQLDGNPELGRTGLSAELDKAYKALNFNFAGINRVCQPCNNHGIRYTTT